MYVQDSEKKFAGIIPCNRRNKELYLPIRRAGQVNFGPGVKTQKLTLKL